MIVDCKMADGNVPPGNELVPLEVDGNEDSSSGNGNLQCLFVLMSKTHC